MGFINRLVNRTKIINKLVETLDQVATTMRHMFHEFDVIIKRVWIDVGNLQSRINKLERQKLRITRKRLHSLNMYAIRNKMF